VGAILLSLLVAALGIGRSVATAVLTWLSHRSFWQLAFGAALIFAGIQTIRVKAEQRHSAKVEAQLGKCTSARHADQQAYAKAQADAQAKNKAHVANVEAQQQRISDERLKDANDRLARLAGELRARGPAAQGHSNGAGPSPLPDPASGTDDSSGLCLSPAQLLRAAEDEERHDQLIQWIEQQLKVDPNKP
jgi:hypothetical protein